MTNTSLAEPVNNDPAGFKRIRNVLAKLRESGAVTDEMLVGVRHVRSEADNAADPLHGLFGVSLGIRHTQQASVDRQNDFDGGHATVRSSREDNYLHGWQNAIETRFPYAIVPWDENPFKRRRSIPRRPCYNHFRRIEKAVHANLRLTTPDASTGELKQFVEAGARRIMDETEDWNEAWDSASAIGLYAMHVWFKKLADHWTRIVWYRDGKDIGSIFRTSRIPDSKGPRLWSTPATRPTAATASVPYWWLPTCCC